MVGDVLSRVVRGKLHVMAAIILYTSARYIVEIYANEYKEREKKH